MGRSTKPSRAKIKRARELGEAAVKRHEQRIPFHLRIPKWAHKRIGEIVKQRGYPHTLSSVGAELLELGIAQVADGQRRGEEAVVAK